MNILKQKTEDREQRTEYAEAVRDCENWSEAVREQLNYPIALLPYCPIALLPYCLILRIKLRTQNSELRTQNSELRTQNSELRTQNSEPFDDAQGKLRKISKMANKKSYGRSKKAAEAKSPIVDATTQKKIFEKNIKLPKAHTSDSPPSLKTAKANLKKIERILAELNLSEANKMTVEMGLQQAEQHMNLEEISQQRIAKAIKQVLEALQGEKEFEAAKGKLVTPVKTVARWLGNNWLHILELLEEESPLP